MLAALRKQSEQKGRTALISKDHCLEAAEGIPALVWVAIVLSSGADDHNAPQAELHDSDPLLQQRLIEKGYGMDAAALKVYLRFISMPYVALF